MLSKKLAAIDKTRCVACGVCENTCPLGAVKVRRGCYAAEPIPGRTHATSICACKRATGRSRTGQFRAAASRLNRIAICQIKS